MIPLVPKILILDPIYIYYDINCKFYNHFMDILEQMESPIAAKIVPVIGELHVHAHERLCQILLHPKMVPGTGLTDGEELERLWSRSGKLHHIVKEQSPDNRRQQLDDHYQHEFAKKEADLSRELKRKQLETEEGLQVMINLI